MDLAALVDAFGETRAAVAAGALTGLVFGVAAQRSAFCLRAATVEFARGTLGPRVAVWLLAFSTAVVWVQGARLLGLFAPDQARMMAVAGSLSGAILGGLMVGAGMVLARGCPGRLLVLAATGNLRSVVSGLVFAVVAQMSLSGLLAPLRTALAGLWTTRGGHNVDALAMAGLPDGAGLAIGAALAALALVLARRNRIGAATLVFASGVGFSVALGWVLTFRLAQVSFDPVSVTSVTFSGPSADTLMAFLLPRPALGFDTGLVPGVAAGAFLAAAAVGGLRLEGFEGALPMRRSLAGAALMGFGAMLAGGCAIGAGVTGGSIFALTAWVALTAMWAGGMVTDRLLDAPGAAVARPAEQTRG